MPALHTAPRQVVQPVCWPSQETGREGLQVRLLHFARASLTAGPVSRLGTPAPQHGELLASGPQITVRVSK